MWICLSRSPAAGMMIAEQFHNRMNPHAFQARVQNFKLHFPMIILEVGSQAATGAAAVDRNSESNMMIMSGAAMGRDSRSPAAWRHWQVSVPGGTQGRQDRGGAGNWRQDVGPVTRTSHITKKVKADSRAAAWTGASRAAMRAIGTGI
jgi:hypothetical protein